MYCNSAVGDCFILNLTLIEEEESGVVGVWGQRHLQYLKEYRITVYLDLLVNGGLNSYLSDIEEQAQGITEWLKADNVLEWGGRMNNIWACARKIVDSEIICQ